MFREENIFVVFQRERVMFILGVSQERLINWLGNRNLQYQRKFKRY